VDVVVVDSVAALVPKAEIEAMVAAFRERHDYVVEALNALPGVTCLPGQGAFYSFPDVSAAMAALGIDDDVAFSEHLLEKAGVAVVPGSAFGAPGHVRLSYATSLDALREAIGRIESVLSAA
jgi:aspartate aminotransferase